MHRIFKGFVQMIPIRSFSLEQSETNVLSSLSLVLSPEQ